MLNGVRITVIIAEFQCQNSGRVFRFCRKGKKDHVHMDVWISLVTIKINIKVVDKDRHNHPVINAKISISIDNHKEFDVIANDKGEAMFDATTSMKNLSLQIVDADDSIQNPMFELQDEQYFLKEGNVHIKILEREVSLLKNIVSGFF